MAGCGGTSLLSPKGTFDDTRPKSDSLWKCTTHHHQAKELKTSNRITVILLGILLTNDIAATHV